MNLTHVLYVGAVSGLLLLSSFPISASTTVRSHDGADNNPNGWGAAGTTFTRIAFANYSDGLQAPSGTHLTNPRELSNLLCFQSAPLINNRNLSDFAWQWGQFIDHDITLTETKDPTEPFDIPITDTNDPLYSLINPYVRLNRSNYDDATGTTSPRQQVNSITAFLDGSMVYGSSQTRADALRAFSQGKLLTSPSDDLLPLNLQGLPNANEGPTPAQALRLAGDVRANEQSGLTALHTLFLREHNRLADLIAAQNPALSDEEIYQTARRWVSGLIQVITYREYLPCILGPYAPSLDHQQYDPTVNPSINSEFATAIFRFGHTMISPQLLRVQDDGSDAPGDHVPLQTAFFNPDILSSSTELNYILKGLASQHAQEIDTKLIDDLRNFLFGPPGAGGLDLASLNIQRGRDHGLPDYNTVRYMLGLPKAQGFSDVTSSKELENRLAAVYPSPDEIDLWVGALAEDHLPGTSVGELAATLLQSQFKNLMIGDRFFFLWDPALSDSDRQTLRQTSLADVIKRNTGITQLQNNVFLVPEPGPDSDQDGIPDWWELAFGLNPNNPADADEDPDLDLMSNRDEYLSGTNPLDPSDLLHLSVTYFGDGMARLAFDAMPNIGYMLQYRDNMFGNDWQDFTFVPADIILRRVQIIDPMSQSPSQRFYRLFTQRQ